MPQGVPTPPGKVPLQFTRRPHREGDDVALLQLLRAAFGEWPNVEIQVAASNRPARRIRNEGVDLSFLSDPDAPVHVCAGDTDLI
jgi:hypothetical protein